MDGDPALKSVYKGKTYYFCTQHHKELFDTTPDKFANATCLADVAGLLLVDNIYGLF